MSDFAVSIVMPALNAATHIGEALGSIAGQRRDGIGDLEVIVADGGSTDATRDIAASFAFVRLLEGPDGGIYQGFNRALAATRLAHVGFVNADDILPAGALAAVAQAFATNREAAMVSGAAEFTDARGTVLARIANRQPSSVEGLLFGIPAINARFFRRDVLLQCGGFRPAIGIAADRELLIRLLREGVRGVSIDRTLYRYRMHGGSTTISGDAAGRRRVWKAEIDLAEYLLREGALWPSELKLARRSRALAKLKQLIAGRSVAGLDARTLIDAPAAVVAWRRWRGKLSGF